MKSLEHIQKVASVGTRKAEIVIGEIEPAILEVVDVQDYSDKETVLLSLLASVNLYNKSGFIPEKMDILLPIKTIINKDKMVSKEIESILSDILKLDTWGIHSISWLIFELKNKIEKTGNPSNQIIKYFFDKNEKFLNGILNYQSTGNNIEYEKIINKIDKINPNEYEFNINDNLSLILTNLDFIELKPSSHGNLEIEFDYKKVSDFFKILNLSNVDNYYNKNILNNLLLWLFSNLSISDISRKASFKNSNFILPQNLNFNENIFIKFVFDFEYPKFSEQENLDKIMIYRFLQASIINEASLDSVLNFLKDNNNYIYSPKLNLFPPDIIENNIKHYLSKKLESKNINDYTSLLYFINNIYKKELSLDFSEFIIYFFFNIINNFNFSLNTNEIDNICRNIHPLAFEKLKFNIEATLNNSKKALLERMKKILELRYRIYKEFDEPSN